LEVFKALFELVDFSFDVEEVLKSFFDGEFEEDVSFLEVAGCVVEFKVVNREDMVGDEVLDERRHVNLFGRMFRM